MFTVKVLNLRNGLPSNAVRIDRATKWGNPFIVDVNGTRDEVIEMYRKHLWYTMNTQPNRKQEMLSELAGRNLACWCAPLPCHGDVLIRAIKWLEEQ